MWNKQFTLPPECAVSEFTAVPKHLNVENSCLIKQYRKIRNDHTFSYNNKCYLIESPLKYSIAKQAIELRFHHDSNAFTAYFADKPLSIAQIVEPKKHADYEPEIQKKIDAIELADLKEPLKLTKIIKIESMNASSRRSSHFHCKIPT